jgi:hypothetical protein
MGKIAHRSNTLLSQSLVFSLASLGTQAELLNCDRTKDATANRRYYDDDCRV